MKKQPKKEPPRYIANTQTREIHDLDYEDARCNLDEIPEEHIKPYSILVDALIEGYKQCQWCFDK
jgi:hypothetical protein